MDTYFLGLFAHGQLIDRSECHQHSIYEKGLGCKYMKISKLTNICTSRRNAMSQFEVTQLWNKTQHQLRADEFQIPPPSVIPARYV
jgi:hypothetical protein